MRVDSPYIFRPAPHGDTFFKNPANTVPVVFRDGGTSNLKLLEFPIRKMRHHIQLCWLHERIDRIPKPQPKIPNHTHRTSRNELHFEIITPVIHGQIKRFTTHLATGGGLGKLDRKSTRLNSSHVSISY